jgi:hypothetical protein
LYRLETNDVLLRRRLSVRRGRMCKVQQAP